MGARVRAGRTHLGGPIALVDVSAVPASPLHFGVTLENGAVLHVLQKLAIPLFVFFLDLTDLGEDEGCLLESLLLGYFGETGIQRSPFHLLAVGRGFQIGSGGPYHACGIRRRDLNLSSLEELEESLGVFLLILRRLQKEPLSLGNGQDD